jgi:type IX secretion system PorP/SprF family membrane protein
LKKLFTIFAVCALLFSANAQQWPNMTGYASMLFYFNPAYTGTKSNIDARLFYRKQWIGFESAPITQMAMVNSRLWKGKLGVGGIVYKDETGPSTRMDYTFSAAYHLHFPDVEFSAGAALNRFKYTLDGNKMTTHFVGDPSAVTGVMDYDKTTNANVGVLLFNDRFHFGLGVMQFLDEHAEFFDEVDTAGVAKVGFTPHYYFTCGYNFHGHPDYVWENNLMVTYLTGSPMTIDYNLRVHFREKIMGGVAWRLKDAIALQAGYVLLDQFQVIYSYDIGINSLRKGHSGSHEVMLAYRMNFGGRKGGYKGFDIFQHQRYHLF